MAGVSSPASAASTVQVEARHEKGFGRLVLTFDKLPGYSNELASGVFVLSFDKPIETDISDLADRIPDYLVVARADPDGRALRMALSRSFRVNLMEAGNQLYIDLLPPDWKGLAPGLPQDVVRELARKAAEAEAKAREEERQRHAAEMPYKLDVRLARHPTFTRIVFDWNQFVTVNLARNAGTVVISFGRKAKVDLSQLKQEGPAFLRRARVLDRDEGMAIELWIDDDVDMRGFREGFDYVVDLTGSDAAAGVAARPAMDAAQEAAGIHKEKEQKTPRTQEVSLPASEGEMSGVKPQSQPPNEPAQAGGVDLDALNEAGESEAAKDEAAEGEEKQAAANTADMAAAPKAAAAEPVPQPAAKPMQLAAEPAPAQPSAQSGIAAKPQQMPASADPPDAASGGAAAADAPAGEAQAAAQPPARDAPAAVRVEGGKERLTVILPFAKPVASAVFRRGNSVWIVLDSSEPLDDSALKQADHEMIEDVVHARVGAMQYFRIKLSQPWLAYASQIDNAWIVSIGNMVTGRAEPLHLERGLRADKRSLVKIKIEKAGRVHWLADSELGDQLAVVTAFGPPRSVTKPQAFVEFDALTTAQGLAVHPKSDDLAVRLTLDEVVITRREGLTLSAGNAGQYVPGKKALAETSRPGFLDFKAWRIADAAKLTARIYELQADVASGSNAARPEHRYELARTYLANGLTVEALGVTQRMLTDDPNVDGDPAFNALRGAALVLLRRPKEAAKELSVHALARDPHSALWRGMIAAQEKDYGKALAAFEEGSDVIASYPADVQARFRLTAARAALALEAPSRMAAELDAVPDGAALPENLAAEYQLVKGHYLERIGRTEEAMETYERVLKSRHEASKAEADLAKIGLGLRTGAISRADALTALEGLRLYWRGDAIELGAMRLMADLYVREERYRDAFEVMEAALRAFPEEKVALQIQDDMKLVFQDLFLHGKSDKMRMVDAVSLYYEHREMTPVGRLGDDMIRKLADRLISVDLLDQAAALLEHQVEKRLSGAARAQVATRLAMVCLMNHKPEMALRAIRRTRQAGLPQTLLNSRSLLEARALSELGRADAAIEILNTLNGAEVERLKADALWLGQQWSRAGEQMEKMLGTRWQEAGALTDRERFDVLRAGISYSLAPDQFALDRLRKKFYEKMVQSPEAESFALVTRPVKAEGSGAVLKLAKEIAAIDTLDAFMKDFRERYDPSLKPPRKAAEGNGSGSGQPSSVR